MIGIQIIDTNKSEIDFVCIPNQIIVLTMHAWYSGAVAFSFIIS